MVKSKDALWAKNVNNIWRNELLQDNVILQEVVLENDGWSTNNIKRDVFYEEWVFLYSSILYLEIVCIYEEWKGHEQLHSVALLNQAKWVAHEPNLGVGWAELMEGYHKLDIDKKRQQPPMWIKIRSVWRVWKSKPWHEKRNITIGFLRSNSFSTRPQKVRPLARPRSLCDVLRWPTLPFHSENWH